jgi:hypothetical protein
MTFWAGAKPPSRHKAGMENKWRRFMGVIVKKNNRVV